MDSLEDKFWQKIKENELEPIAKQNFFWKRFALWTVCFISLILSSLITAVIIFIIENIDWDISGRFTNSKTLFLFFALPYFWMLFLIIFYVCAHRNYRHTKYGYRIRARWLLLLFLTFNIILGLTAYKLNFGHRIEEFFSNKTSFYSKIDRQSKIWNNPNKGLLAGKIKDLDCNKITLTDLNNQEWQLILENNNLPMVLKTGEKIKVIGRTIKDQQFLVEEVRPWCGCNHCINSNSICNQPSYNNNSDANFCQH